MYAAAVANGVTRITLEATASSAGATVEYLDGDGTTIDDADAKAGHQVNLEVGANKINVRVTAGDNVTTETYGLRRDPRAGHGARTRTRSGR